MSLYDVFVIKLKKNNKHVFVIRFTDQMEFYLDTEENKSIINQNKWKIFWENFEILRKTCTTQNALLIYSYTCIIDIYVQHFKD